MEAIDLTKSTLQCFEIGKIFRSETELTSLDFSPDGHFLLSSSSSITLYNVFRGTVEKSISAQSSLVHFTNHTSGFISAGPGTLDYWSLQQTRKIHAFAIQDLASIDMSPRNDTLIAGAVKQVTLFDLNTKKNFARLELSESMGNVICKYDPTGLIFIVAYSLISEGKYKNVIQVFDSRKFSQGAFNVWTFEGAELVSIDFSSDGQFILVNSKQGVLTLIDSISGKIRNVFKEFSGNSSCNAVFSPDSRYFFVACEKNFGVVAGSVDTCSVVHELKGNVKSVKCMAWSPEYCVFATGNDHLLMWVPDYLRIR
jgi:WD40 repeat protein